MSITTNSRMALLSLYAQTGNEVNSISGQLKNDNASNSAQQAYENLETGLQNYNQLWQKSLQSSGLLIDTTPAQDVLKSLQPLLASLRKNHPGNSADGLMSDWEIYDQVCKKLDYMQTNYMDIYAGVTEQYQLFMQDVNSFKVSLTEYMDNGTDKITLNLDGINAELNKVIDKWSATPILTVGTMDEAAYWQEQLGLPYKTTSSGYVFYVNLEPMYDIQKSVGSFLSPELSTARFNQWQNSVNSSCSTIESDTQIMAQKYSQANTVFNNLAKILSSTMDSLYQTDKEFLRN